METVAAPPLRRVRLPQGLVAFVAFALVVGALAVGYWKTQTPIKLIVDGHERRLYTHQDTVGTVLMDVGLTLREGDSVEPIDMDTPLQPALGGPVSADQMTEIERAYAALPDHVVVRSIYRNGQARVHPRAP